MPRLRAQRTSILNLAIGGLTLLLLVNTVLAYFAMDRISAADLRVRTSEQILMELRGTLTLMLECETGQRGYVITGKREYLAPYERALHEIDQHLTRLESHASENPVLSAGLPELRSLSTQKLQEFAQTIDLRERGQQSAAINMVMSDSGKAAMDRLREVIDEMIQEQRGVVAESNSKQQASTVHARYALFIANVAAIVFLLVIGYLLKREARIRAAIEEKLRLAEKLSATARLAHTMAHYVNNPLEALSNCIYLAQADPDLKESTRRLLKTAEEQVARAGHISKQTLGLHRNPKPTPVLVRKLLDEVIALYSNQIEAKNIQLTKEYGSDASVSADIDDLREAMANVISNGLDACERGGMLKVRTADDLNRAFSSVLIEVEDNGIGIPREHQERLFSPFFTTKPIGTGLGLWATKQIVESCRGSITFTTSLDGDSRGTKFAIVLPTHSVANASDAVAS